MTVNIDFVFLLNCHLWFLFLFFLQDNVLFHFWEVTFLNVPISETLRHFGVSCNLGIYSQVILFLIVFDQTQSARPFKHLRNKPSKPCVANKCSKLLKVNKCSICPQSLPFFQFELIRNILPYYYLFMKISYQRGLYMVESHFCLKKLIY